MPDRHLLTEATATLGDIQQGEASAGGRFRVLLIRAGWGSSGYYSEDLLKRDGSRTWGAGTQMYLNHPTATEAAERPERAVEDWASVLTTDPVWDPAEQGLVAEVEVFPQWRWLLNAEFTKAVGLSIRASGTVEYGEAEGREGPIVTSLTDGISVDWVTRAGAGGRVLQLIESARLTEGRHFGPWDPQKHPRADDGKFGHGSGNQPGGGSHGSRSGGSTSDSGGGSSGGDRSSGASTGSDSKGGGGERGLPKVLASDTVSLADGTSLTLERRHGDDDNIHISTGDRNTTVTRDNATKLLTQVGLADDWDPGDEDDFDGMHLKKTGAGQYQATLPDGTPLTLSRRDGVNLERSLDRLNGASRVDTGNGDVDVFAPGPKKVGIRHIGDDGHPTGVEFSHASIRKIENAVNSLIDDIDDPDIPDKPSHRKVVSTNAGKVRIEIFGDWGSRAKPGDRLEIMPVDDASWGLVIDGPQENPVIDALHDAAVAGGLIEAHRRDESQPGSEELNELDREAEPPSPNTTQESAMTSAEGPKIGAWLESRLHLACTQLTDDMYGSGRLTRDERLALSSAIGDGLAAFTARLEADQPQLYTRGLYDGPDAQPMMSEAARALLVEAHGMTANELRDALCDVVKDAYGGKDIWVWVRDYNDAWVVWSLESGGDSGLYQQAYTVDETSQAVTLTGEPVEVIARTTYIPEPQAAGEPPDGQPVPNTAPVTENAPGNPPADTNKIKESGMPELTEEQARHLAEAASVTAQLQEAITRLDQASAQITTLTERADASDARAVAADARSLRLENDKAARAAVAEALKTSDLPARSHARVTESVCRELPTVEGGALDTAKLAESITAAIDVEKAYTAGLLEDSGVGQVRSLGESAATPGAQAPAAAPNPATATALEETYKARGLSPEAARLAAVGRL